MLPNFGLRTAGPSLPGGPKSTHGRHSQSEVSCRKAVAQSVDMGARVDVAASDSIKLWNQLATFSTTSLAAARRLQPVTDRFGYNRTMGC